MRIKPEEISAEIARLNRNDMPGQGANAAFFMQRDTGGKWRLNVVEQEIKSPVPDSHWFDTRFWNLWDDGTPLREYKDSLFAEVDAIAERINALAD